jgi:c-di-GMP-binding flagellar brake protein YcgR
VDGDSKRVTRPPRIDVQNQAMLIFSDGSEVRVTVTDLSEGGFRLTSEEILVAGEQVRLRADRHGEVRAEIRWVDGFKAGGVFLTPAPELD